MFQNLSTHQLLELSEKEIRIIMMMGEEEGNIWIKKCRKLPTYESILMALGHIHHLGCLGVI